MLNYLNCFSPSHKSVHAGGAVEAASDPCLNTSPFPTDPEEVGQDTITPAFCH